MKPTKIVALFLAAILLISSAVIYTLPRLVDTEILKAHVISAIEAHTQRKLDISGKINFSFYPKTELELNDLKLSDEGFDPPPFIKIKTATLKVKLLPLLKNQLSVQQITLDQLKLNLSTNSKGGNNWSSIVKALQNSNLTQSSMGKLLINQATIHWKNDLTNNTYTVDNLFLSTNKLSINHSLKMKSRFNFIDHQNQSNKSIVLASYIKSDSSLKHYDFNHSNITIKPKSSNQSEKEHPPIVFTAGSGILNLSKQTLLIPSWNLKLFGVDIQGETSGIALLDAPEFDGTIKISNFNPRTVFEEAGQKIYTARNPSTFTKASIKSQYTATPDSFVMNNFYMRFDNNILDGFVEINDFNNPAIDFSLNLNKLATNNYLPEKSFQISEWPLKTLRTLDVRGILKIESLDVLNLTTGNNQIAVLAENGLIQFTRIESIIHGGELGGEITLDIKTDKPKLNGRLQLTGLNPRSAIEEWKKSPLETPYIDAFHRLDFSFQIASTQEFSKLSEIEVKLDQSNAKGALNIEHSNPPTIAVEFNLDHFNLDHYLRPEQVAYNDLFTTMTLPNNLNSTLNIEQLTAFGHKCEAVKIQTTNTPKTSYLIKNTSEKAKDKHIVDDNFPKLLLSFMKSQCLKS